jgi:hypothetical protein
MHSINGAASYRADFRLRVQRQVGHTNDSVSAHRQDTDFRHFVHEESVFGREEWTIDLGNSNAALFKQLFGHMFDRVTVIAATDDPQLMDIDALVEPSIDAFEFSTPEQSNTDAFAVWIRYRLKVFDQGGTLVSNWPVSAYGKSQTTAMNKSDALQRAAVLAMRDAACRPPVPPSKCRHLMPLKETTCNPVP